MKVLMFLPDLCVCETLVIAECHWPDFGMNVINPSRYENTQSPPVYSSSVGKTFGNRA